MRLKKGYVALVLHSHLPFVRHPDINDALEERWLFEVMSECYMPLLKVYEKLLDEGIDFKVTMSITPPLMEMLEDEYLNERYFKHLRKLIELTQKEIVRTKNDEKMNAVAYFYNERFVELLEIYNKYDRRILNGFKRFSESGNLEIITCSATHALLPLLEINEETIKAQLTTGVENYYEHMGKMPNGIWLPECAYTYKLESYLRDLGIKYFICESKGIQYGSPRPRYGTAAPVVTPNGIVAFGRDEESSHQVWSSFAGYPGDVDYREFYRDIGFDLPKDYIGPYINAGGIRIDTGIKYHRITGKTENKDIYNREWAMNKVESHATHFTHSKNDQIESLSGNMDVAPILTCPYDTELFGHWWFEGPEFIEKFMRKSCEDWTNYQLITPWEYINKYPSIQCSTPSPSSWGADGDYSVWLNGENDWIYKELHQCEVAMTRLANTFDKPSDLERRALNQAARELMLAESSDWPFIIKTNTTVQYAVNRINSHINKFSKLYDDLTKKAIEEKSLNNMEEIDNIFKNIDYTLYKSK